MGIKLGYLEIFTAAFIWGTIGAFTRWSGLTPLELAFYRVLIAAIALFLMLPRRERLLLLHTRHGPLIVLAGVLFTLDILLFFYAIHLTSLSNAVLPYNMQPLFMVLLTSLLLGEKMQGRYIFALVLAVLGVGVLLAPALLHISYADITGISYALIGAFLLAVIAVIARIINIQSITFVYYQMLIATICLFPFMRIKSVIDFNTIAMILIISLVHTAFAYIVYYDGLKTVSMQHVVALSYLTPCVAALTGSFLFQEAITVFTVVGGLIIIINGALVVFRT